MTVFAGTLTTERLVLVPATADLARVERDKEALGRALAAEVPSGWPPPIMADALGFWAEDLARQPELVGWTSWYWILSPLPPSRVLVGYGGFKGPPDANGVVEIGYAVLEEHQKRGYAREAAGALIAWAMSDQRVRRVDAETLPHLSASIALLEGLGFRRLPEVSSDVLRFARERPPSVAASRHV